MMAPLSVWSKVSSHTYFQTPPTLICKRPSLPESTVPLELTSRTEGGASVAVVVEVVVTSINPRVEVAFDVVFVDVVVERVVVVESKSVVLARFVTFVSFLRTTGASRQFANVNSPRKHDDLPLEM
jgi:hypothetical protein